MADDKDDKIVVIAPKDLNESKALSKDLAASALMPVALRKKPEDVLAIVLTGAELGLAPMQAVRGIHIISGKVSLSADLMGALVKRSQVCEYLQLVESTDAIATYRTKRKGEPGETTISFTIEQAKAAGLLHGDNWKKYPAAMLRARCLAAICRAVYPDLCLGVYDSDSGELEGEAAERTAQQAHVNGVKEKLREVVDGEVVREQPPLRIEEMIQKAPALEALKALIPELKKLPNEEQARLKPIFAARRAELTPKEAK